MNLNEVHPAVLAGLVVVYLAVGVAWRRARSKTDSLHFMLRRKQPERDQWEAAGRPEFADPGAVVVLFWPLHVAWRALGWCFGLARLGAVAAAYAASAHRMTPPKPEDQGGAGQGDNVGEGG